MLDWKSGALAEGLRCYGNAEYFVAHEHWESVWLGLDEPEKSFLQALIQTTAAFYHLNTENRVGAASLLRRALRRLDMCSAEFGGVDVVSLKEAVGAWLGALENGNRTMPEVAPRIRPVDFEKRRRRNKGGGTD
jgi:hypothetical protein